MTLSLAMAEEMKALKMRDTELAIKMGCNPHTIGMWRRGNNEPSLQNYLQLCKYLPGLSSRLQGETEVA